MTSKHDFVYYKRCVIYKRFLFYAQADFLFSSGGSKVDQGIAKEILFEEFSQNSKVQNYSP